MSRSRYFLCFSCVLTILSTSVLATSYTVNVGTDTSVSTGGAGTSTTGDLRYVLNQILNNQAQGTTGTHTIEFDSVSTITLTNLLPPINLFAGDTITIGNASGPATEITGGYRPFFICQGTVNLQNMSIVGCTAQGGNGGTSNGGGGMGAGGAIFIDGSVLGAATVTIADVTFSSNVASSGLGDVFGGSNPGGGGGLGGNGGNGTASNAAGGGGGYCGNGGNSAGGGGAMGNGGDGVVSGSSYGSGGGGGAIIGANGGNGVASGPAGAGTGVSGYVFGGGGGGSHSSGDGGAGGGTGPNTHVSGSGGGGGYNVMPLTSTAGGTGGGGGGGGGANPQGSSASIGGGGGGGFALFTNSGYLGGSGGVLSSISGSFGGGGGGGVDGGFGGGGGGFGGTSAFGGGGGANASGGVGGSTGFTISGGDGAAFGGAVFVAGSGNTILFAGNCTTSGNNANSNGGFGASAGTDFFAISGGTLVFAPGSDVTTTITGTIADDSVNSVPDDQTWAPGSGAGANLTMQGPGTLVLSGANTYAGTTTVSSGTLNFVTGALGISTITAAGGSVLQAGGATATIAEGQNISFSGSGVVTFDTQTYGMEIQSDIGTSSVGVTIIGSGGLTFNGVGSYFGDTTVSEGFLALNGSLTSPITVSSGATLQGTGSANGVTVESGGTIAPGNSIGTMNLALLLLNSGSITDIEINDLGQSSEIIVSDMATLAGTVHVTADAGTYTTSQQYTILQAGALSGEFDPTVTGGPAGCRFTLVYDSPYVYLNLIPPGISTEGLHGNALRVATYLNKYGPSSTLDYLENLSGKTLKSALDSVCSSRNAFGAFIRQQTAFSLSAYLMNHLDEFRNGQGTFANKAITLMADASEEISPLALQKDPRSKYSGWVAGFGEYAHASAAFQNPSFQFITGAALGGFDYRGENRDLAGGAIGYAHTDFNDAGNAGHGNINYYFGSVYGNLYAGNFYFSPAGWGIFSETANVRHISFPEFSENARAKIFAWQFVPHLELGYEVEYSWGDLIPFTVLDWAITWQRGYQERGAAPFNATAKGDTDAMVRTETGLKFCERWEYGWGYFFLREKLSYVFEKPFGTGKVRTAFTGIPTSFAVVAVGNNLNLFDFALDFDVVLGKVKPFAINLGYEGQFGSNYWSNELMLTLRKEF